MSSSLPENARLRASAIGLSFIMLASACAGGTTSDGETAAVDTAAASASEEVATTAPLADVTESGDADQGMIDDEEPPADAAETQEAPPAAQEPVQEAPPAAEEPPAAQEPVQQEESAAVPVTPIPPTPIPPTAVPEPTTPPPPPAATVALPAVDVINLANGQTANLASFSAPGATLVWFWAPH